MAMIYSVMGCPRCLKLISVMNFGDVIMSSDFLRNGVLGCGETWVVACMAMDVLDRGPMLLAEGAGLNGV
ncbi:hypothetical protein EGT56_08540 [Arachnia propionica]|nr:hypothetical protein EGT56_08540 [Arachnia propionica]